MKADTIEDLVNDINDIQNEMKSLSTEVSAESKILDQSIEEINKKDASELIGKLKKMKKKKFHLRIGGIKSFFSLETSIIIES